MIRLSALKPPRAIDFLWIAMYNQLHTGLCSRRPVLILTRNRAIDARNAVTVALITRYALGMRDR